MRTGVNWGAPPRSLLVIRTKLNHKLTHSLQFSVRRRGLLLPPREGRMVHYFELHVYFIFTCMQLIVVHIH
jgi:hypothetical protein